MIWVVDSQTDRVYKYSTEGALQGEWSLHGANNVPTGITIDPTGMSDSVWVVDAGADAIYEYQRDTGAFLGSLPLDTGAGNDAPSGIADPPQTATNALPDPLSAPPPREPGRGSSLRTRKNLIFPVDLKQRAPNPWPYKTRRDAADDSTLASDIAGNTNPALDMWPLPFMPADYVDPPHTSPEIVDVRVLDDIADEETELLDEDLLVLIAVAWE